VATGGAGTQAQGRDADAALAGIPDGVFPHPTETPVGIELSR
jgi:hypothetical protein